MKELGFPRISYDDFYKFICSLSMVIFLISTIFATYSFHNILGKFEWWIGYPVFYFYFLVALVSIFAFAWALMRWKKNQEKLNAKLNAETLISILKFKKESVKYQTQINELAKEEHPFKAFNFLKNLQRKQVEEKINENLKSASKRK